MESILEKLFNSRVRAKVLKLFFRNPEAELQIHEIADRTQTDYYAARREVLKLKKMGLIKGQKIYKLDKGFSFVDELRNLILHSAPISQDKIVKKLARIGRFKLVLLSGVFMGQENSRLDLFLVGNNVSERALSKFLKDMEAEVGKEIDYALFTTEDFQYRKNMFDKLVIEVLEGPKVALIDRFGIT